MVTNMKAYDFHESIGVNIHLADTFYWDNQVFKSTLNSMASAMQYIGTRRCRDYIWSTDYFNPSTGTGYWTSVVQAMPNVKIDFLIMAWLGAPYNGSTWGNQSGTVYNQQSLITSFAGTYLNNVESIECPAQINNDGAGGGTHGPTDQVDQTGNYGPIATSWAQAVYNWRNTQTNLVSAGVKVVGPTIVAVGNAIDFTSWSVASYVDAGNMQIFPGVYQPDASDSPLTITNYGVQSGPGTTGGQWTPSGSKPGMISTIGYHSPLDTGDYVSDLAQAKLLLNSCCDLIARGGYKIYLTQLQDDANDPGGSAGSGAHYGLFHYDWTPKLSAQAFNRMFGMINDLANGATFTPNTYPNITLTPSQVNNPSQSGQQLLLAKSDGTYVVVIWNEPQVFNGTNQTDLNPAVQQVTVNWGSTLVYNALDPITGATSSGTGTAVSVNMAGYPQLIHLATPVNTTTVSSGASFVPTVNTVPGSSPNNTTQAGKLILQ